MKKTYKTIYWVTLFAIAMGMFECIVVVYLREMFYKSGFAFPLKPMPAFLGKIEVFREAATIIMLIACGNLAGNSRLQRFAYFALAFAIWDLFYYIFLYIFISWPQSLFTWDILFLIPVPWVGPVWAPCLICLIMISGSLHIIHQTTTKSNYTINGFQWSIMIGGALLCIVAFMWDYLRFKSGQYQPWNIFSTNELFKELETYIPQSFNHLLFFTGFLFMTASLFFNGKNLKSVETA